jgi:hypothetical protein
MRASVNLTNWYRIKGNISGREHFSKTAKSYTLLYNFRNKSLFIFNPETFFHIFATKDGYACDH